MLGALCLDADSVTATGDGFPSFVSLAGEHAVGEYGVLGRVPAAGR